MTVYSFYIFDRHGPFPPNHINPQHHLHMTYNCLTFSFLPPAECIYSKHWLPRPSPPPTISSSSSSLTPDGRHRRRQHHSSSTTTDDGDQAKLIFGAVFSLRSMVRKLGGADDAFVSYATADYKLHFFETASNLRFVLLTDPATQSMRSVLHQIYVSLWVEHGELSSVECEGVCVCLRVCVCGWVCFAADEMGHCAVVKNPLAPVEHKGGEGVRSELFEQVLDRFLGVLGHK